MTKNYFKPGDAIVVFTVGKVRPAIYIGPAKASTQCYIRYASEKRNTVASLCRVMLLSVYTSRVYRALNEMEEE